MSENEKIQSFTEMVEAADRLSRPWKKAFIISNVAHVIVEIALAILLGLMIWLAYMEPVEVNQTQDFDTQYQEQFYANGAANGG